jgi:S-DNA-T family DNA segregation ATPase FtsK/SpoIIIE
MNAQNQNAIDSMVKILEYYKTPCDIDDIIINNFSIMYHLIPKQGITVNKLKRILPDISIYFDNPDIIIDQGLYLKIDNKNAKRIFYDFFQYADKDDSKCIPIYAGIDEKNSKIVLDLATLPHLLIAGSTGSGKSVFIHDCILSLLSGNNKILMIDPKKVELSMYKGVKGVNVITEPNDILNGLQYAVNLMYQRYSAMESQGITDGHNIFNPYIIIIDELADIMLNKAIKKECERLISKLTAMGRAAAIHMIIATQRPSVNILTGIIKVNIPTRISFKTSSAIDSRCILNKKGSESLRGMGDGYILTPDSSDFIRFQAYSNTPDSINSFITPIKNITTTTPKQKTQKQGFIKRLFA